MTDSIINKVPGRLARVDHESVCELHGLGTSSTELSGYNDLTTLSTRLHNETEDTIASTTDGKTTEKLVAEGLALSNSRKTTVLNLFGVEFQGVFGELETLLDKSGEFTDATTLLTKNFLGVGSTDDNLPRVE